MKNDMFKSERECFRVLGEGFEKIYKKLPSKKQVADAEINHHGSVKPPFSKREKEAMHSPFAAY
jgi:hypothetical protein